MKFRIEPGEIGYLLYVKVDDKWEMICFRSTFIGAKFAAWRYSRHHKKSEEFEL